VDRRRVVRHLPYGEAALETILGGSRSAKYLAIYLGEMKARSMLLEEHYVDRHYLEDFAHFYSRSFGAPDVSCQRLHFFQDLDDVALDKLLTRAYRSPKDRDNVQSELNTKYLGFVVRRPLRGAEVGRTVVRPYPPEGRRHFDVVRPYRVNVAGLALTVEGLAYQQQDGGAAVCASISLWCAFQQVAHMAGHRTPTPTAVTSAAESPFPASHGLDYVQMAGAISRLGYIADQFVPGSDRALFRAKVVSYLQSHLPVVLLLTRQQASEGERRKAHAVTVTGFSACQSVVPVVPSRGLAPLRMRSGSVETLYVHDDNLGAHAHYELLDMDAMDHEGEKALLLHRGSSHRQQPEWWAPDDWVVDCALVPKPSKLRMPIESLLGNALEVKRILAEASAGVELDFETRFASGVEYKRSLFELELDRRVLRGFQQQLGLPRYVGVISAFAQDSAFHAWDALIDVTEVNRGPEPNLLGVVAPAIDANSPARKHLDQLCTKFQCPLITGPPLAPKVPSVKNRRRV
jgi:hypothetical protein